MGYYYGFDPTYLLVLIGAGLCMLASFGVQSTYRKYEDTQHVRDDGGSGGKADP